MKNSILKICFVLFTVLIISHTGFSQEQIAPQAKDRPKKAEAHIIDEFESRCSEDLAARYDSYAAVLHSEPSAVGYIVFYGGKTVEGANLHYMKFFADYGAQRGLDSSRLKIVRGANLDVMKTQFWLVPSGADVPKIENEFENGKIIKTIRFEKGWADFHKMLGRREIYFDSFNTDWGCDFAPNVKAFAEMLLSDEDLTGYLVIYGNKKNRAEKVVKFAINDLIKKHKIPRNRLKTIYGGKSEEPQIEFWFVPKNGKPPIVNSK